jgi:hypothetical protein
VVAAAAVGGAVEVGAGLETFDLDEDEPFGDEEAAAAAGDRLRCVGWGLWLIGGHLHSSPLCDTVYAAASQSTARHEAH